MEALATGGEPVDGRRLSGMSKRVDALAAQITRTVDLAAQIEDPAPVLRRVHDLERQRAELLADLADLTARRAMAAGAASITEDHVRGLLAQLLDSITRAADDSELRGQARMALREVLDRVEIDAAQNPPVLSLHYAVQTGDMVASPRGVVQTPAIRWSSPPVALGIKRRA